MKKLILTLAIVFSITAVKSSNKLSELNLKLYDNAIFSIMIDNISYNTYSSVISVPNLSSGNHFLKVFRNIPAFYNPYASQIKTVYAGYVFIPAGYKINAVIDNLCRYTEISKLPVNHHVGNHGNNYNNSNYEVDEDDYYAANSYGTYNSCMNGVSFMQLKSVINNSSFDSSKLKIAQQAVSTNFVSSEQVAELMSLLSFESSKLELAKFAFKNTINKNKYFLVNNEFTFSSSIDELNKFIACGY
jgi:hypothetical protein